MPGTREIRLLKRDALGIQAFLEEFEPPANGEFRRVEVSATGEFVAVQNFPLPDGFRPDHIDLLLIVLNYPMKPPTGIYVLQRNNQALIAQLRSIFNVFDRPAHNTPAVPGYAWICWHFQSEQWQFNLERVAGGDNLRKFLIGFYNNLLQAKGGG